MADNLVQLTTAVVQLVTAVVALQTAPLLLVPRHWARPTLLMSAGRYYETSVLSFAQFKQNVVTSNGKVLKTPKDVLRTQPGLERGRNTNLTVTQRAHRKDEDLVAVFRDFVRANGRMDQAGKQRDVASSLRGG